MGIFGISAGVNATELTPIALYPGHGTTLNFRAVNEKVQRVWLDDPSQVTGAYPGDEGVRL
jgi:hypothetical protein